MSYVQVLSPTAFLTVEEIIEWLNISSLDVAINQLEVKSQLVLQHLLYTSKKVGALGNTITVQYVGGATKGSEVVSVIGDAITVQIEDGVSTSQDIKNAIESNVDASALVGIQYAGASTGDEFEIVTSIETLSGGINEVPTPEKTIRLRKLIERCINIACEKVESILQTRVVAQAYEELHDGNNANVIVPSKWPITEITEIKIDYNRNFGPETIISLDNSALRGFADKRQKSTDVSLRIIGNDIALRDDNKDSFIGKIFSGSVIQAIKIKYKAGWAIDNSDIPWDLRHAATLLVEYYYFQRSNRDLNVSSKGVRGESYTKVKDGIPDTVWELLDPYMDVSLPLYEKSQTNIFDI